MKTMIENFKAARRAGTPLIAITCFDPEAVMQAIQANTNAPLIQWDCQIGWRHRNAAGLEAIIKALDGKSEDETISYTEHLAIAKNLPFNPEAETSINPILFVLNAHRYFEQPEFVQALWNLRDEFKDRFMSVVLLGPEFNLPSELQQDILVLDEALPTAEELAAIVKRVCKASGIPIAEPEVEKAVDALRGLAAFPSEQAVAMSLTKVGLNLESLWERKRQMIKQTAGLSVWMEGLKFDDVGGLDQIKSRFRRIIKGKACPRVIVWIDEIEKCMAGSAGSANGYNSTEQDQLGVLLSEMQDRKYTGAMLVGVPGGGKSMFAKVLANEIGVLLIKLDLGGAKGGGLVGQAENSIRQAMKIVHAVGGDEGAFFIATSNDINAVKPELKRRFKKGIWFFDLPAADERKTVWDIYLNKFEDVPSYKRTKAGGVTGVDDSNWTPAEIETCVTTAWEEGVTLQVAAADIVPVAVSGKEQLETLRREAHDRYNSVSYTGVYNRNRELAEPKQAGGRKVAVEED